MIAQNTIAKPVSRLRGILLAALACLMPALVQAQAALLSEYRFDDVAWCTPVSALDTVGGRNGSLIGGVAWEDSPASGGKPVNGAAVGAGWSGVITGGDTSRTTDLTGLATFYSSRSRSPGTVTFCVTGITKSGLSYDGGANLETCEAITK